MLRAAGGGSGGPPRAFSLRPRGPEATRGLQQLYDAVSGSAAAAGAAAAGGGGSGADGGAGTSSHFDRKTDSASSDLYFHYYGEPVVPSN